LRISIAIEKFNPRVGGAERYCWDIAHFLAGRGHEVGIICMTAVEPESPRIRIHRVPAPRFPQFLRHLGFALLHSTAVRRLGYDLDLSLGNTFAMDVYQPRGGIHRAWAERELVRYPEGLRELVGILRKVSPKNVVQEWIEHRTFTVTKPEVVAISAMIRDDLTRYYGYPRHKVRLIPNAIDTGRYSRRHAVHRFEVRSRYGLSQADHVFLSVSNNLRLKGFDLIVDACRELLDLPLKVLVIGDDAPWARRAIKDAGLEGTVVLGGRAEDLEKIYPACDCLVHPAYYDACSRVVLEALASGIPVITTEANGAKMYVNEGNGCVIPAGDSRALAGAMRRMASDLGSQVGEISFKDHSETFRELEGFFEELILSKGARP